MARSVCQHCDQQVKEYKEVTYKSEVNIRPAAVRLKRDQVVRVCGGGASDPLTLTLALEDLEDPEQVEEESEDTIPRSCLLNASLRSQSIDDLLKDASQSLELQCEQYYFRPIVSAPDPDRDSSDTGSYGSSCQSAGSQQDTNDGSSWSDYSQGSEVDEDSEPRASVPHQYQLSRDERQLLMRLTVSGESRESPSHKQLQSVCRERRTPEGNERLQTSLIETKPKEQSYSKRETAEDNSSRHTTQYTIDDTSQLTA